MPELSMSLHELYMDAFDWAMVWKEWSLSLTWQGSFRNISIGAFGAEPLDFQPLYHLLT